MSALELIPAIDLKGGKCVRLRQGRMDDATVFGDDPVAMARSWEARGRDGFTWWIWMVPSRESR